MLEARVARLLHSEGAFVRTDVDLNAQFRERFGVTDLDVLAFYVDRTLGTRIVNGECKSSASRNSASSGDRLLWLAGVARIVDAHHSFLVIAREASDNARALASRLQSEILDPRDLARREQLLGLQSNSPYGSHGPVVLELRNVVQRTVATDPDLQRAYAFVRSDLWLSEPTAALKRTLGASRLLGSRYSDALPSSQQRAIRWLAAQVITGFLLATVRIASIAYRQPEDVFERLFHERLAEGVTSYAAMRELSRSVDHFVAGLLAQVGRDPGQVVGAIGAFEPKIPTYAQPLTELIQRLALAAPAAADLPRLGEHYLLAALEPSVLEAPIPAQNEAETARLLRLAAAFLEHQAQMPSSLLEPLRSDRRPARPSEPAAGTSAPSEEAGRAYRPVAGNRSGAQLGEAQARPKSASRRPRDRRGRPTLFSDDRPRE
jgi:hypothetical protein